VYNSTVASFRKLATKWNEEEYAENLQREFPKGIPSPRTLSSVVRHLGGQRGLELRLDHKLS